MNENTTIQLTFEEQLQTIHENIHKLYKAGEAKVSAQIEPELDRIISIQESLIGGGA